MKIFIVLQVVIFNVHPVPHDIYRLYNVNYILYNVTYICLDVGTLFYNSLDKASQVTPQ